MESEGFERLISVAVMWGKAPSSYLRGLTGLQAFWIDEAAAVWLVEVRKNTSDDGAEWVGEDIL